MGLKLPLIVRGRARPLSTGTLTGVVLLLALLVALVTVNHVS
jgi:hypothetical protein